MKLARLFNYENAGTVEFIVDADGNFHFTEIKSRIQVEHPLTEMRSGVDLIREQIRIAAGETTGDQPGHHYARAVTPSCVVCWHVIRG